MIMNGYMTIIKEGPDARQKLLEDFAIASNQAGIAFGNTGVGAVCLFLSFGRRLSCASWREPTMSSL